MSESYISPLQEFQEEIDAEKNNEEILEPEVVDEIKPEGLEELNREELDYLEERAQEVEFGKAQARRGIIAIGEALVKARNKLANHHDGVFTSWHIKYLKMSSNQVNDIINRREIYLAHPDYQDYIAYDMPNIVVRAINSKKAKKEPKFIQELLECNAKAPELRELKEKYYGKTEKNKKEPVSKEEIKLFFDGSGITENILAKFLEKYKVIRK